MAQKNCGEFVASQHNLAGMNEFWSVFDAANFESRRVLKKIKTNLPDVYMIESDVYEDERRIFWNDGDNCIDWPHDCPVRSDKYKKPLTLSKAKELGLLPTFDSESLSACSEPWRYAADRLLIHAYGTLEILCK